MATVVEVTKISEATLTIPANTDLIPIARPSDTTSRRATLESVINALVGGDASSNTPNQDTLGMTIGQNNDADWGGVAIGLNNSATGTAYQSGAIAIGEGNTVAVGHVVGRSNTLNGDAFIFGDSCNATGTESVVIGYRNTAAHEQAVVIGLEGTSRLYREHIEAFGSAYAFIVKHLLSKTTTSATPAVMGLSGGEANKLTVKQDSSLVFTVRIVANTQDAAISKTWIFTGAIKNTGGTVGLLGSIAETFSGADAGASTWAAVVSANDTDNSLDITVTGAAGTTIIWYAVVEGLEHYYT